MKDALPRLDALEKYLREAKTQSSFRVPENLVEKIIRNHLNCDLDIASIQSILDSEIRDMQAVLNRHAVAVSKDTSWQAMIENMPLPKVPAQGLVALYREQVLQLAEHCLTSGLLSEDAFAGCPVQVLPVPAFLSAIRTASSYSIQPDYPPTGGIFYVINADKPGESRKAYQREFRILSAHETYPGHHFLDSARLHHNRPLRRCIERPVFYEGWACFAEQLMRLTGYLDNEQEHMLLARRRLWRAMRGKVDLGLQTGSLDFEHAIKYLMKTGINKDDAVSVVRKYPLNPGYQLCYTLGFKRFSNLFKTFGRNNLTGFVRQAVSQGEIDFRDLEQLMAIKIPSSG